MDDHARQVSGITIGLGRWESVDIREDDPSSEERRGKI